MRDVAYLLDANVVSEMMKREPAHSVTEFLDDTLHRDGIGIATVTIFEILNGVGALPEGRRRRSLAENFNSVLADYFAERIFDWTVEAAAAAAVICEKRRRAGEPLDSHLADAMLAGLALSKELTIVTRNESEFRNTGVDILNPWTEAR